MYGESIIGDSVVQQRVTKNFKLRVRPSSRHSQTSRKFCSNFKDGLLA